MNPADFLTTIWGKRLPTGCHIQLWELGRRRSSYLNAPAGARGLQGASDFYTAVALTAQRYGPKHRARADQAAAIAGLWLDADVNGGPDDKTGAIPTRTHAIELAATVAAPTLIVNSGYGIHAWWLLPVPWVFTDRDDQRRAALMSAQWHALHRTAAAGRGWGLDHTHDLARLLRLPGTINAKGGTTAAVEAIRVDGPRYTIEQLAEWCATARDVTVDLPTGDIATGTALPDVVSRDADLDDVRLDALRANIPEFDRSWLHARGDGWSLSEYDLSIATYAAQAQWTDQEIADLIVRHRRLWDPADRKAARRDYLRRTVAKARNARDYTDAAARAAVLANTGRAA